MEPQERTKSFGRFASRSRTTRRGKRSDVERRPVDGEDERRPEGSKPEEAFDQTGWARPTRARSSSPFESPHGRPTLAEATGGCRKASVPPEDFTCSSEGDQRTRRLPGCYLFCRCQ